MITLLLYLTHLLIAFTESYEKLAILSLQMRSLVGFINFSPHLAKFIFKKLRLFKDSREFNHFSNGSFINPIENTSDGIFFCYSFSSSKIFSISASSTLMNACLVIIKPLVNPCGNSLKGTFSKVILKVYV